MEAESHSIWNKTNQPHESFTELTVICTAADLSAMLFHIHLLESVTKGLNSSITVAEHTDS